MVGNFAQIYSPYLYNKNTGPQYLPAMIANTVFVFASILCATVLYFCLRWENKKLAAEEAHNVVNETANEKDEIIREGPGGLLRLNPGFRYAI
jgi:hypothetical protein